ncbi:MAG: photosystem II cytochrome PsbV2 [Symploca sp. SIO1C4]|uniref:Photosystem II cytochrome PsbV2 n=1 Tax=Symploca sp. SIO1C4 TaxID=2607765 RepID=A0A6B3NAJ2_9CYAN|nr:photosystem II cytochrome PsbV2 [Symploca sp. SIO1C4]
MLVRYIKIAQFLHSWRHQLCSGSFLLAIVFTVSSNFLISLPAEAATDTYVRVYLEVREPIALELNEQGETKLFSTEDITEGKELFKANCINCHVGGKTLPYPPVSLALDKLSGATPPRDNINGIVNFLRQPMTYDGSEETFWCRTVTASWMPQEQIEKLAAFVLRAAQKAPGWAEDNPEQF